MKLKEIPWYNRPGIRLKRHGVDVLSDAELLAVVLGRGNTRENAVDLSNRVLGEYNLDRLVGLSFEELKTVFRNQVPAMKLLAVFELFRRTNKLMKKGFKVKIRTAEDVYRYYVDHLQERKKEHFYALFLDTKNQVIGSELISVGTLNASLIHPREVFHAAIRASCNSIILVHNHPSGDIIPSFEDKEITKILFESGKILGINVLDHIIIGKDGFTSFKDNNLF
jgi:DNA repair protein RadC